MRGTVHSADGRAIRGSAVVVCVPLHALNRVTLEPPPPAKHDGITRGQASRGVKVRIRLRGKSSPFAALGGQKAVEFLPV
ncbi:FAD-dependent oxidoreductase [Arthrobacter sp. M4]|uniref:FAD-dependent oxidoreductase n=1 Tax=Arthrobacter sp. M4 TaxID=218160 RepID=UPI001CDBD478|nr:FAD-dependent oxidoreductase [Arthrobacter sp. M4]MCA4135283.1 FAD-dependent oxidoreductase [Arthrobacter sp. M4]